MMRCFIPTTKGSLQHGRHAELQARGRPKTSSVPVVPGHKSREVSQFRTAKPDWPFKVDVLSEPISNDSRAQLAAMITHGHGERFAEVIVNQSGRALGWGLMEPADDRENAVASHPQLLKWLAREFLVSGYDLKHVARLIMNSHVYQRWWIHRSPQPGS